MLLSLLLAAGLAAEPLPNPYREIPPERNAWPLLVEAGRLLDRGRVENDYPSWRNPFRPDLRRSLAANEPALAKLDEALARPTLAPPPSEAGSLDGGRVPRLEADLRELARLKVQRAYARSAGGDRVGAVRDLDDLFTLVDRLDDGPSGLVPWLTTRAIEAMAAAAAQVLLGPPPLRMDFEPRTPDDGPEPELPLTTYGKAESAAWDALSKHLADESRAVSSLRLACGGQVARLRGFLNQPKVLAETPGPAPTAAQLASYLDAYERAVTELAAEYAKPPARRDFRRAMALAPVTPPGLSPEWREALTPDLAIFAKVASRIEQGRAQRRLTVIAIALRQVAGRTWSLPNHLADLVQWHWLPAVPLDPTDGRPLRYRPADGLLWACGRDGTDHGGYRGEDAVARLWFVRDEPPPARPEPLYERAWIPVTRPVGLG
jgi:hypothetical protein